MLNDFFKKKKKNYASIQPRPQMNPRDIDEKEKIMDKCKKCNTFIFKKELAKNLHICPKCNHHYPISAPERIHQLVDEGSFVELEKEMKSLDPLNFPTYQSKIKQDIEKTNINEAVIIGKGTIDHQPVVLGVMDSRFRMGSMGSVVGEKITKAIEVAIEENKPFILFSASGGARMQEGVLSLMQMAKTSAALEKLHQKSLLFISVLTNPTTGGVSASFASLGDINIAEPQALIGFAGRRIIEQTIREELPEDFQTAEFLLKHGQLDLIIDRKDMRNTLGLLVKLHPTKEC